MRSAIILAIVVAASPIAAQPVTSPTACAVTISRAPDDVRAVVEAWVKAEPRCASSVDVRIVPTDGGLYLLAQDEHGRVRERIVPDAQSAGVLIASWIADDTFPPEKTVIFVPDRMPPSRERPQLDDEGLSPPGQDVAARADELAPRRSRRRLNKWLAVGLLFDTGEDRGGGIRGELDLLSWKRWSAGLAVSRASAASDTMDSFGFFSTTDTKALAYLVRTLRSGNWYLRASIGAGVVHTSAAGAFQRENASGATKYLEVDESAVSPTGEGGLVLAYRLGDWALHAGPVVSAYSQTFEAKQRYVWEPMNETIHRPTFETRIWVGLRHRL